ncbi:MAG: single-stranded DNA-binding protein [Anaerolineales bacterium]
MSYTKLLIVGNLGRDPEMRYLESGQAVTNFSIASNRQYTASNGERVKETTWFRVTVWGRQAETCNEYLKSGSQVLIEGRLNPDKDTGGPRIYQRNDGGYAASFEVTADRVVFLTRAGGTGGFDSGGPGVPMEDDEIPF